MHASLAIFAGLTCRAFCYAEPIDICPAPAAITIALKSAKPGDVIRLAPGLYTESITLPAKVSLEATDPHATFLVGEDDAIITCRNGDNRITGLTLVAARTTTRGIIAAASVRIERCTFDGIIEAIILQHAPLSDVVACDFLKCPIAMTVDSSSPTVLGCRFVDGGVTALRVSSGDPYIRNCSFWGHKGSAIGLFEYRDSNRAIVRNCYFSGNPGGAIIFQSAQADVPRIHHNVFSLCTPAIKAQPLVLDSLRDCVVDLGRSRFQDSHGHDISVDVLKGVLEGDGRATLAEGAVQFVNPRAVITTRDGRGRSLSEFGPEEPWKVIGTRSTSPLPPLRFGSDCPVVNSEREEEQILSQRRLVLQKRERITMGKNPIDRLTCQSLDEDVVLLFDVTRIVEEEALANAAR
jgi:hypothetical protein